LCSRCSPSLLRPRVSSSTAPDGCENFKRMHGPRRPARRCSAASISLSSPWCASTLALHHPMTFMPLDAATWIPSSSSPSSSLGSFVVSTLCCLALSAAPPAGSFPLFFFSSAPSGSAGLSTAVAGAARSTTGGSTGIAVTASDVSSGRSLTDSVASNAAPPIVSKVRMSISAEPRQRTLVSRQPKSGEGCSAVGVPSTARRPTDVCDPWRASPTNRESIT